MPYEILDEKQVEEFLEVGYVRIHECFGRDLAEKWQELAFKRLGYDPGDPRRRGKNRGSICRE